MFNEKYFHGIIDSQHRNRQLGDVTMNLWDAAGTLIQTQTQTLLNIGSFEHFQSIQIQLNIN